MSLDAKSRALLDEILEKDMSAVTEGDRAILRARVSYLTAEQVKKYGADKVVNDPYMNLSDAELRAQCALKGLDAPEGADTATLLDVLHGRVKKMTKAEAKAAAEAAAAEAGK